MTGNEEWSVDRRWKRATLAVTLALLLVGGSSLLSVAVADDETLATISFSTVAGDVDFEHEMHYSDLGIACAECHHETDAGELDTPHDEYLETFSIDCGGCHREGVEASESRSCSHCHHDTPTTIADETLSPKVVIHEVCWRCHEIGRGEAASRGCKDCHRSAE
jgi:hypothetical protein